MQIKLSNFTTECKKKKEHWGFDDPAGKTWTEFQRVRDEIKLAIENFKTK